MTDINEQLKKLVRALVNGGIAGNEKEAIDKAREMLKMPKVISDEKEESPESLPGIGEISEVPIDLDIDKNKTLKELLEEDGKKVYGKSTR